MVAVVERGEFCWVLRSVLFMWFLEFLRPVLFLLILLVFMYIAKVGYDYMVWVLIQKFMVWPFVLQFSSSPFDFISSPFMVAFVGEVDFDDLEANLFSTVRFLQLGRFC